MSYSNRFWRTLPNSNALSYVATAVAYTTRADYKTFVANAVNGEVGVYNADTFALLPGLPSPANLITAGTRFFFAVKRGNYIEKSPVMTMGSTTITRSLYIAPVKPIWTIVTAGTAALLAGQIYEVVIIDQTTAFTPYPTQRYQYVAPAAGAPLVTAMTKLNTDINNVNHPENRLGRKLVSSSITGDDLTITADYFGSNIKVMTGYDLSTIATVTNTAKFNLGSGVPDHVQRYQESSDIMKGATHIHANLATAQPANYGIPPDLINYSGQYVTYQFINHNTENSPTPVEKHFREQQVLLFAEDGATDPLPALNGAFLGL